MSILSFFNLSFFKPKRSGDLKPLGDYRETPEEIAYKKSLIKDKQYSQEIKDKNSSFLKEGRIYKCHKCGQLCKAVNINLHRMVAECSECGTIYSSKRFAYNRVIWDNGWTSLEVEVFKYG